MSKKHCMFQYTTAGRFINTKIYEDTGLITWEEAIELWQKYKEQFIGELESGLRPEMAIWTGCKYNTDYHSDPYHIDYETPVENGEFFQIKKTVIDPSKATMGEPV